MNKWASEIKNVEEGKGRGRSIEVSLAMIAANNHYAGFGPGTVNIFRNMIGKTGLSWQDQENIQRKIQQDKRLEKEQHQFSFSNIPSKGQKQKRQSSLTEYID